MVQFKLWKYDSVTGTWQNYSYFWSTAQSSQRNLILRVSIPRTTAQGLSANRHSQFTYVAFNTSNIDQRWLWQLNIIPNCNKLASRPPLVPHLHIWTHVCVLCVCLQTVYLCFSLLHYFYLLFPSPFIMGRARLQIKEASRETEWAVTTCDAICYPQRIASGRLTRSIHLASAALIKQMPADVWLCRNEFLPLWAGNCSQSHFLSDLWSLNKHTHRKSSDR